MNFQDFNSQRGAFSPEYSYGPKKSGVTVKNHQLNPTAYSLMSSDGPLLDLKMGGRRSSAFAGEDFTTKLKRIMQANQRNHDEARVLYEHIKNFPFFETFNDRNTNSHFGEDAFIKLCQSARYEKHPAKKVIFKENDPSNGKLYIIYSGEVSIVSQGATLFVTQNPESPLSASSKTSIEDLSSRKLTRENSRVSRSKGRSERLGGMSPYMTPRGSKFKPAEDDGELSATSSTKGLTRRPTGRMQIGFDQSIKRMDSSIDTREDNTTPSLKKDAKKSNFSKMTNLLRDSLKSQALSSENVQSLTENDMERGKTSQRGSSEYKYEEEDPKKDWRASRLFIPPTVNTSKVGEESKYENMSLKQIIKEHGAVERKATQGEFVGERAVFEKSTRSVTIITNTECEFLVIYKRDFYHVSRNYDQKRTKLLDFIFSFTPDIDNIHTFQIVEELLLLLQEKSFEKGTLITTEAAPGNSFFMLYEGTCELIKTLKIDETPPTQKDFLASVKRLVRIRPVYSEELSVCNVEKGAFLGEEVVISDKNVYSFSVRVTSASATVLAVNKEMFLTKFTSRAQHQIKNMFTTKRKKHINLMNYLLQTRYPNFEILTDKPSSEKSSQLESRIVTEQIMLKSKKHVETNKKSGLFRSIAHKGNDASLLSQYIMTSPAETITSPQNKSVKMPTSPSEKKIPNEGLLTIEEGNLIEEDFRLDSSPRNLFTSRVRPVSHRISLSSTPVTPFREHSPITETGMSPSFKKALTRANSKTLKVNTGVDYITSKVSWNIKSTKSEQATPKAETQGKRPIESPREAFRGKSQSNIDGVSKAGSPKAHTERKVLNGVDENDLKFSDDMKEGIIQPTKRMRKMQEIKKKRIAGKFASTSGSIMTYLSSPREYNPGSLVESIQEKFHVKIKGHVHQNRILSPRQNTGPFLLIKTPILETLASPRSPGSHIRRTKSPLNEKTSLVSSICFPGSLEIQDIPVENDEELLNKHFEKVSKTRIASIVKIDRPQTAGYRAREASTKNENAQIEEVMSKAKNDPNTKMLRMKFRKILRLRKKIEDERKVTETTKEEIIMNYKINGALQSFKGQGIQKKNQKRPLSSMGPIKTR